MVTTSPAPVLDVRLLVRTVRRRIGRGDLMLTAAAMTAYAVFGLVPLVAVGLRLTSGVVGADAVVATGRAVATYLSGPLRVDDLVVRLSHDAATGTWWLLLFAALPVSLYAEGTVRSLETFSAAPATSKTLRGRLLTVPLALVAALAVATVVVVLRPLLEGPFGRGTGPRLLGILVGFVVLWAGATALLCLVYRLFASTPVRPAALLWGAAAAGSWLAGQTMGYVLTIRLVTGFAKAYAGDSVSGAVAAIAFLLYLNHVVVLVGYALALSLHERPELLPRRPSRAAGRR